MVSLPNIMREGPSLMSWRLLFIVESEQLASSAHYKEYVIRADDPTMYLVTIRVRLTPPRNHPDTSISHCVPKTSKLHPTHEPRAVKWKKSFKN